MAFFSILQSVISNTLVAGLIIVIGLIIARFLGKLTRRILKELEMDRIIKDYSPITLRIEDLIGNLVKYITYIITAFMALNQVGITGIVFFIIMILGILISISIVLFDLKDFFHNLLIGLFSKKRKSFKLGKEMKIGGIKGKVVKIRIKEVVIMTGNQDLITIPSSLW